MIPLIELIYGSYVHPAKVYFDGPVEPDKTRIIRIGMDVSGVAVNLNPKVDECIGHKHLTPVTLTGDLLLRMGFARSFGTGRGNRVLYTKKSKKNRRSLVVKTDNDKKFSVLINGRSKVIEYVHILQNVAYITMDEEIKISE